MKSNRMLVVLLAVAFAMVITVPLASADYVVIKDKNGRCSVRESDHKTPKTIAGPFKTKEEAYKAKEKECATAQPGTLEKPKQKTKEPGLLDKIKEKTTDREKAKQEAKEKKEKAKLEAKEKADKAKKEKEEKAKQKAKEKEDKAKDKK